MSTNAHLTSYKVILVGDGASGKSCLIHRLMYNEFPTEYIPSVHDVLGMDREFGGEKIHVGLWDTRVREDNERLRVLSYPQTDLFIICFDVSVMRMFQNVTNIWAPEVSNSGEGAPCVLIGCKSDLRNDVTTQKKKEERPDGGYVSVEEAKALTERTGALGYFECSALNDDNEALWTWLVGLLKSHQRISKGPQSGSRGPKGARCSAM